MVSQDGQGLIRLNLATTPTIIQEALDRMIEAIKRRNDMTIDTATFLAQLGQSFRSANWGDQPTDLSFHDLAHPELGQSTAMIIPVPKPDP